MNYKNSAPVVKSLAYQSSWCLSLDRSTHWLRTEKPNAMQWPGSCNKSGTDVTPLSGGAYVAVGHRYGVPKGRDSFLMQIHSRHATGRQWKPISSHERSFISRLRPSALNAAFVLSLTQRRAQGPERSRGREGWREWGRQGAQTWL